MKKLLLIFPLIILLVTIGCEKDPVVNRSTPISQPPPPPLPPPVVSTPPAVSAGDNIVVFLPVDSAFLNGSATDAKNNIDSYRWSQLSGPRQAIIQTPDLLKTKISKLTKGEYSFELTVTDKGNLSGKDTVNVLVVDPSNLGANIKIFKDLQTGCWGGECLLAIDSSLIPRNIPFKVFLKSADTSTWTEIRTYFFWDKWFYIQFGGGDLEEIKKWEVMVVY